VREWAIFAVMEEAIKHRCVLYGSTALNLYLGPVFRTPTGDLDFWMVEDDLERFDQEVYQLATAVQQRVQGLSGGTVPGAVLCRPTPWTASEIDCIHPLKLPRGCQLWVEGEHIADITRMACGVAAHLERVFPRKTVRVLSRYGSFGTGIRVVSLDEIVAKLAATVTGSPSLDGMPTQSVGANWRRVEKDSMTLDRLAALTGLPGGLAVITEPAPLLLPECGMCVGYGRLTPVTLRAFPHLRDPIPFAVEAHPGAAASGKRAARNLGVTRRTLKELSAGLRELKDVWCTGARDIMKALDAVNQTLSSGHASLNADVGGAVFARARALRPCMPVCHEALPGVPCIRASQLCRVLDSMVIVRACAEARLAGCIRALHWDPVTQVLGVKEGPLPPDAKQLVPMVRQAVLDTLLVLVGPLPHGV